MRYINFLLFVFIVFFGLCDRNDIDQQTEKLITLLKNEKIIQGRYIVSAEAEINNPKDYLNAFENEMKSQFSLNSDFTQIEGSLKIFKRLSLRGKEPEPNKIIHYSDIYEYKNIRFICAFVGEYIEEPTVSNRYKFYQGKGTEIIFVFDDSMKLEKYFAREITWDF